MMTHEDYDDALNDMAGTIAAEIATQWGLYLDEPHVRATVWADIVRYAADQVKQAITEIIPDEFDDWPESALLDPYTRHRTTSKTWTDTPTPYTRFGL
jgi:hypothetical protein